MKLTPLRPYVPCLPPTARQEGGPCIGRQAKGKRRVTVKGEHLLIVIVSAIRMPMTFPDSHGIRE